MPDADDEVLVRITPIDASGRQISGRDGTTESLLGRAGDLERGIREATRVVGDSLGGIVRPEGWTVDAVEATFGVTLGAEGSVIVSKATFEAAFQVTVTYRRSGAARQTEG